MLDPLFTLELLVDKAVIEVLTTTGGGVDTRQMSRRVGERHSGEVIDVDDQKMLESKLMR